MDQSQTDDIVAAIRQLTRQVDELGHAVQSAATTIAVAIKPPAGSGGVSGQGTFT